MIPNGYRTVTPYFKKNNDRYPPGARHPEEKGEYFDQRYKILKRRHAGHPLNKHGAGQGADGCSTHIYPVRGFVILWQHRSEGKPVKNDAYDDEVENQS